MAFETLLRCAGSDSNTVADTSGGDVGTDKGDGDWSVCVHALNALRLLIVDSGKCVCVCICVPSVLQYPGLTYHTYHSSHT